MSVNHQIWRQLMRDNSSDKTIEQNLMQKWRFLIREYELAKAKQHPLFRFLQDCYAFHGTSRQTFAKYCNRFLQLSSVDVSGRISFQGAGTASAGRSPTNRSRCDQRKAVASGTCTS